MDNYYSNSFDEFKKSGVYQELHEFLNEHDNVIRMVTASELGRPSVEAIQFRLADKFSSDDVNQDNFKRWTGRMIREVMKGQGYMDKPAPKKLLSNKRNIFKTGGYYQK